MRVSYREGTLAKAGVYSAPGLWASIGAGRQIAVWAFLWLLGPPISAQTCEPPVAKVFKAQGQVELSQGGAPRWQRVGLDQSLCAGDRLRLGRRSRATVRFADETLVDLDEGSTLILHAAKPEETGLLELLQGALHAISRVPRQLNIRTPIANAGVEGWDAGGCARSPLSHPARGAPTLGRPRPRGGGRP